MIDAIEGVKPLWKKTTRDKTEKSGKRRLRVCLDGECFEGIQIL